MPFMHFETPSELHGNVKNMNARFVLHFYFSQELVGLVLDSCHRLRSDQSQESIKILDLCCGSGAIATSLLSECPQV